MVPTTLQSFEAYGIELEYMIVDVASLSVRPVADQVLAAVGGGYEQEVERGAIAWSNELALHVIELKTNGPRASFDGLASDFHDHVGQVSGLLAPMGCRLLPTGMHPFMDPRRELALWPHENDVVYRTFDRIFDCTGHGWANLQSMHINLPFAGDEQFARLHAAVRLVLPLLPALAASSPYVDGARSAWLDTRLEVYRHNARRVPSVTGLVVPERAASRAQYERDILERIYADMRELDPEGVLRHEWINARGCIARFDRMAIEIRVLDTQECPRADIAIARAVVAVVQALVEERWCSFEEQNAFEEPELSELLFAAVRLGGSAELGSARLLEALGLPPGRPLPLRGVWQHLAQQLSAELSGADVRAPLDLILSRGSLAERLVAELGENPSREALREVYGRLATCLERGELFQAAAPA